MCQKHFLAEHGDALAQGRDLRRNIVGAGRERDVAQLCGTLRETDQRSDAFGLDDLQRAEDLQLLHVLGQVTTGHALVQMLMARKIAELLNARLHIMPSDALTLHDRLQIDLVLHPLVALDHTVWHRNAEIRLALQHRDPVVTFQPDFALATPDGAHGR